MPPEVWRQRAVAGAAGSQSAVFLALAGGRPVGMIMVTNAGAGSTKILSIYVAPAHRRSGLVDGLVAAVAGWSRAADRRELVLEVSDVNARARAAYARLGFRASGHISLHPLFAQITLIEMRLALPR
ncbi:MAG: N-acetyltransferase family protein [Frankiaceae bacterium]